MNGTHTLLAEEAGKRLDHILPDIMGVSRSQVKKGMTSGNVLIDGEKAKPHAVAKEGMVVTWGIEERTMEVSANSDCAPPIIFEDEAYLVLEKPVDVVVHQGEGHRAPDTIANWLLAHVPEIKTLGPDPVRPGIVHRLDRDVSGVMIIAKTDVAYAHLIGLFSKSKIEKEYIALVYGHLAEADVTVRLPIARSRTQRRKMAARTKPGEDTQDAVTMFREQERKTHVSLVRVFPKTGRRHQIRAHAAHLGHPIVGDTLYAHHALHLDKAPRLMLHAQRIAFVDHEGNERAYTSPTPEIFDQFLRTQS